jgi:hypothetical protein
MSTLETRLRRWLRLYPSDQREEMLGVLLATAGPGRERPSPRDAADLVGGAVRVRLRREIRSLGGPVWRDAFAVLSLMTTLLLLTGVVDFIRGYGRAHPLSQPAPAQVWPMWAPWILVAALSVVGRRRTAAGLAWAAALSQLPWLAVAEGRAALLGASPYENRFWFGLAVTAAAALSVSDGLRRALGLLGPLRSVAVVIGVGGLAYVITGSDQASPPDGTVSAVEMASQSIFDLRRLVTVAFVVLVVVGASRLRAAYGRRAFTVLVLCLAPLLCFPGLPSGRPEPLASVLAAVRVLGPLPVALVIAAAATSRLRWRRRSPS